MKRLEIPDAPLIVMALQDEIRRNRDARYDHRLHAVLLVARGHSCQKVSDLLGDPVRTVQSWVKAFLDHGLVGLEDDERGGRPRRLSDEQLEELELALRLPPENFGLGSNLWDGRTLSAYIERFFGIDLSVRQCQRLFRQLGFRYRKPRPMIAGSSEEAKQEFKKN